MKLLCKTVEERYQTAAGVESDLRRCLRNGRHKGASTISHWAIMTRRIACMIPEKLYGRDREIDTLLTAFDRIVAGGRPELVLVSGYSGIGKSAVVNELHKPLVPLAACLRQANSTSTSATFHMPRWHRPFRASSGPSSAKRKTICANGAMHFATLWIRTDCSLSTSSRS